MSDLWSSHFKFWLERGYSIPYDGLVFFSDSKNFLSVLHGKSCWQLSEVTSSAGNFMAQIGMLNTCRLSLVAQNPRYWKRIEDRIMDPLYGSTKSNFFTPPTYRPGRPQKLGRFLSWRTWYFGRGDRRTLWVHETWSHNLNKPLTKDWSNWPKYTELAQ